MATRLSGDREKIALILSPLEETMAFASALAAATAMHEGEDPKAQSEDEIEREEGERRVSGLDHASGPQRGLGRGHPRGVVGTARASR